MPEAKKTMPLFVQNVDLKKSLTRQLMGYLEKRGIKPGMAVWKFVHKDSVIYRNSNNDALKYFWRIRDIKDAAVYARTPKGWEYVFTSQPRAECGCGRQYDDTPNGEEFRWQDPGKFNRTMEDVRKIMTGPVLCMICYYKEEYYAGRWAPKFVKQQLRLD